MRHLTAAASVLCLLSLASAQGDQARQEAFGATRTDGVVHGVGPTYSARFLGGGVEFTSLGAGAAAPATVRLRATSVRRGALTVWRRGADPEPRVMGNRVQYDHGPDLAEVYDVRRDGVEQSFLFATRPAGAGDLVVRVEVATDLQLAAVGDDGARFEGPGGGITFGAVTGVDAKGARVRGGSRWADAALEWSLPAEFVDAAAYPLVLDPLIGSVVPVAAAGTQPEVAYDASNDRYLVVWSVDVGAGLHEIRGQLVSGSGPLFSTVVVLATGARATPPAVAGVNGADRFVVAWAKQTSSLQVAVQARSVGAGSAALSAVVQQSHPLVEIDSIAAGGDARSSATASGRVLVAYAADFAFSTSSELVTWCLDASSAGALSTVSMASFPALGGAFESAAVSRHNLASGHWFVAYALAPVYGAPANQIRGVLVDAAGSACQNFGIVTTGSATVTNPAVAAVGNTPPQFLVAWQDDAAATIRTRRMERQGTCGSGAWLVTPTGTPVTLVGIADQPSLGFAVDKCLLAWRQRDTAASPGRIHVMGLTAAGDAAGIARRVDINTLAQESPAIVGKASGGSSSDEALVVYSNGAVRSRRCEATGTGTVNSVGGACGISGLSDFATYTGTPVIGTTFTIDLLAPSSPILALVVGFSSTPFGCGPCTLVPSPDLVLPGSSPAQVALPVVPGLIGVSLYAQWLQWRPGGCPTYPTLGLSNTLQFVLSE